jgi:hypothetical protein
MRRLFAGFIAAVTLTAAGLIGAGPAYAATSYFYAIGEQFGLNADGAAVNITAHSPAVNGAHDGTSSHSVGELAVFSNDRKNRIEVGWRKPTVSATSVFVYHYVDGVPQGYNLCTDYAANPVNAGSAFPATWVNDLTNPPRFQIVHTNNAWWIALTRTVNGVQEGNWLCNFPDAVWSSAGITWTKVAQVQAYAEVAASNGTATPCSDMGNGQNASSGTAARIASYSLQGQVNLVAPFSPPTAAAFTTRIQPTTGPMTMSVISSTGFRYGTPMWKADNTLPGIIGC